MNPEHHGVSGRVLRGLVGRPDRQIQTILRSAILGAISRRKVAHLGASGSHEIGSVGAFPRGGRGGLLPAEVAHGRSGIRNTIPLTHIKRSVVALDTSSGGFHQELLLGIGGGRSSGKEKTLKNHCMQNLTD
jgi:hypothetical protein